MTLSQGSLFGLIGLLFVFLIWGRFRYDLVAFAALVLAALLGLVPVDEMFTGFSHPAVIVVALVLVISKGLARSGALEIVARLVIDAGRSLGSHIAIMGTLSAALSTLMNNVAALALLMPMDVQAAQRAKRSPALTLMPLSFASILGGMVTLIGTPPNIVIATFREDALGAPYEMFDFAPVGLAVAVVGVLFVSLIGWRLIPKARTKADTVRELMELSGYISELSLPEDSGFLGKQLGELDEPAEAAEVKVLGVIRRGQHQRETARTAELRKSDIVIVEGSPHAIDLFIGKTGLRYKGAEQHFANNNSALGLIEAVVPTGARIVERSAMQSRLLYRQGVTLLGISRKGKRIRGRVRKTIIQPGDILLLLGPEERLGEAVEWLGCLPLAERGLELVERHKAVLAVGVFGVAIAAASFGLVSLPLALAAVTVIYMSTRVVPLSQVYEAIEWPVIVLLGSLIP
ncbi:MAG: SLC13 family permease, partial [Gammaproteobacteria bacterium]|nr:SLC13 family permease [Gammaproteobacteria bacterium]